MDETDQQRATEIAAFLRLDAEEKAADRQRSGDWIKRDPHADALAELAEIVARLVQATP